MRFEENEPTTTAAARVLYGLCNHVKAVRRVCNGLTRPFSSDDGSEPVAWRCTFGGVIQPRGGETHRAYDI